MLDRRRRAERDGGESARGGRTLAAGRRMRTDGLRPGAPPPAPEPGGTEAARGTSDERAGWGSPIGFDLRAAETVPAIAAAGVADASAALPHREAIQRAFGRHDVSGIRAGVGGSATSAAGAIGARAYAVGERVGFAAEPDLRTAAHEAAHVIQQGAGVSLAGGVGRAGDEHEQQADRAADAVVAGRSAEAILDQVGDTRGAATAAGVQRLSVGDELLVDAADYLRHNQHEVKAEIGRALRAVDWPEPHPRLGWRDRAAFVDALFAALDRFVGTFDRADSIEKLVHPARALRAVDALRPIAGVEGSGTPGGSASVGPTAWRPQIGTAIARLLEESMRDSLVRLGARWLAAAERGGEPVEGAWVTVEYAALVTSHPVDRVVGRAMCAPGVFLVRPGAAAAAPVDLRPVELSWQGARSPCLWNWVRALDPADATAEEVAAELFAGSAGPDESASFRAYRIVGAAPLFAVPPEWALGFAEAKAHAPETMAATTTTDELATVAGSELADDIALSQASDQAAAVAAAKDEASAGELLDVLAGSAAQMTAIIAALAPWALAGPVGAALGWIHGKELELAGMDTAERARWVPVLREQTANLRRIGGAVVAIDGAAGGGDRTSPGSAPLREVLETYAQAATTSHLGDTCRELIERAARQQARLPLRALDTSTGALAASVSILENATGPADEGTRDLREASAVADRDARALAGRLLCGAPIAPGEIDDVMLTAGELALDNRLAALDASLGALERAAEQAGDGFIGALAALPSSEFRNVTVVTAHVRDRLAWVSHHRATHVRAGWVATPADLPPDQAAAIRRRYRQEALAAAQGELARIAENHNLADFLRRGAELVDDQSFRTACIKVATLVGVSIAGGLLAGQVARAAGGTMLAAGASPAMTGLARAGAALVVDTTVNAEAQRALFGGSRSDAYLENLLAGGASMGISGLFARSAGQLRAHAAILAPLARGADELATLETRAGAALGRATSAGGHLLVDFSLGTVARRVASAESEPPPETVREWLLEAASIGLGRLIARGVHARIDGLRRLTAAGLPDAQPLLLTAETLAADADALANNPDPARALDLLARRRELLSRELDTIDALAKQPDRLAAAGVARSYLGPLRRERLDQLAAADDPALATLPLHLAGLEELVPGALWQGAPDDIARAMRAVRAATPSATVVHDPATGRHRLSLADLTLIIHERPPPARLKTVPMASMFAGEHLPGNPIWSGSRVTYLSPAEREAFKLHVRDGKLYNAEGELFDTADAALAQRGRVGRAIAVMDANGNLYASKYQEVGKFHHSSLMAGEPVAYAGEIKVEDGVLTEISNQSGHYRPPQASVDQARQVLESSGVDFSILKQIKMGYPSFPGE